MHRLLFLVKTGQTEQQRTDLTKAMALTNCQLFGAIIGLVIAVILVVVAGFLIASAVRNGKACGDQAEGFAITGADPGSPVNTVQLNQPVSAIPLQAGYAPPNVCGPHTMIPVGMQSGFNIPWYGGWRTPVPNLAGILREDDWEQRMYGVLRNRSIPIQDANPASAAGIAAGRPRKRAAVDAAPVAGQVNLQYHMENGDLSTPAVAPFGTSNSGPSLADLMSDGGALQGDGAAGVCPTRPDPDREAFCGAGSCAAKQAAVSDLVGKFESPEARLQKAYHKLPASNMAQGVLDRAQTKSLVTMVSRRGTYVDQSAIRKDKLACADWLRGDLRPAVENTWNVFRPLTADRDRDLRAGALGVLAAPGGPWNSTSPIPENMAVCHIDDHCGNNDTGGGGGRGASFVTPISP